MTGNRELPGSKLELAGRLLFPAVRWAEGRGFDFGEVERAVALGVGGLILFGGEAPAVLELTAAAQRLSAFPLLISSDLERGAGQQFHGATRLPPAAALGYLDDPEVTRRAALITAREALALGVGWLFAPVADLAIEPRNPIVGTRAFAADARLAARHVEAWVRGCAEGGALSCVKHFPGQGRAVTDSHVGLPRIDADPVQLEEDLVPFRAGIAAGTDAVMAGHVAYPALDPSGVPASRSAAMLQGLLRGAMRFDGLVATDAINMVGFGGVEAAAQAVIAGADALLYPAQLEATVAALAEAVSQGRLREAAGRIDRAARRVARATVTGWGRPEDRAWARETALRTLVVARGEPRLPGGAVRLVEIDDDLGGPHAAPSREPFRTALERGGVRLAEVGAPVIAVYADVRAWKGYAGLSGAAVEAVALALEAMPDAPVVLFCHPWHAQQLPGARHVLAAWGGEEIMQVAAADWLTGSVAN